MLNDLVPLSQYQHFNVKDHIFEALSNLVPEGPPQERLIVVSTKIMELSYDVETNLKARLSLILCLNGYFLLCSLLQNEI